MIVNGEEVGVSATVDGSAASSGVEGESAEVAPAPDVAGETNGEIAAGEVKFFRKQQHQKLCFL